MGRENVIGDVEFVFTHTGMTVETMRIRDSIREEGIERVALRIESQESPKCAVEGGGMHMTDWGKVIPNDFR